MQLRRERNKDEDYRYFTAANELTKRHKSAVSGVIMSFRYFVLSLQNKDNLHSYVILGVG